MSQPMKAVNNRTTAPSILSKQACKIALDSINAFALGGAPGSKQWLTEAATAAMKGEMAASEVYRHYYKVNAKEWKQALLRGLDSAGLWPAKKPNGSPLGEASFTKRYNSNGSINVHFLAEDSRFRPFVLLVLAAVQAARRERIALGGVKVKNVAPVVEDVDESVASSDDATLSEKDVASSDDATLSEKDVVGEKGAPVRTTSGQTTEQLREGVLSGLQALIEAMPDKAQHIRILMQGVKSL